MPKVKEQNPNFKIERNGHGTIFKEKTRFNFDAEFARLHSGVTGNCGMSTVSGGSGIGSKAQLKFIAENSGSNRLLFDVNVNVAKNLRKWATELKYKVLGSFKYHSRYVSVKERTAKNKTLNILIIEVDPYKK